MTQVLMTYMHLHKDGILDGWLSESDDKYTETIKSGTQTFMDFEVYE
jgi:hypothetical protein